MPSDRAKRLVEALHEPHSLETRWEIADSFLAEERADMATGIMVPRLSDPPETWRRFYQGTSALLSERIAQTRGENEEAG